MDGAVCLYFQPFSYSLGKCATFCWFEIGKMFLTIVHAPGCMIADPNDECIRVKWGHDHQLNPLDIACLHCLHIWWINNALFWFELLLWMVTFMFCSKKDDFCWEIQHPWVLEALKAMKTSCGFMPTVKKSLWRPCNKKIPQNNNQPCDDWVSHVFWHFFCQQTHT